jgi:hypothetical protein
MAPFLGVVGVEPVGGQPVSAILGGAYGGNLVLRDFIVGRSLFLPVMKQGARIWTGDVHALQGDGVVDQTAIETAAEDLRIRYRLHKNVALRSPLLETKTAWICIGFGESLDDALVACLREVIHWLSSASGISEAEVYALASMSVSFPSLSTPTRPLPPIVRRRSKQFTLSFQKISFPACCATRSTHGFDEPEEVLMTLVVSYRLDILDVLTQADNAASRRDRDA